jgi:phage shock protein PspC (stress-responsive transcriptional regulator)
MKKIININLAGRVIPIEDAAYESLQRYIESLRRYFAKEEGRDEIINDIESRIAELMNDKIRKGASAITEADIEEIITSMGRVEDFEAADAEAETESKSTAGQSSGTYTSHSEPKKPKGRLYRDLSDKFLGGVCSGIANYMNVDPAVVRLLFAIITFGGFGFGFLLYIFLWIFLPARDLDTYVGKRLFRNPDDMIIGGVAGGLAAYFNKSSRTVRLIFAAPLLLNILFSLLNALLSINHFEQVSPFDIAFGSISSTFILAYLVLWIVLPLAKSPFEKMEMRGEKVDVNRIKQNVQEGMGTVKERMSAWGEEVKSSAQKMSERAKEFTRTQGADFAADFKRTAKPVASGFGHAIGVIIKAFFLFVFGSLAFALFVGLMVVIFGGGTVLWPLKQALMEFVLDGFWQKFFFWGTLIFFIAVPIVAFLTWLIRRIMRVRSQRSYLGWVFGGLWTLGWICIIMFASLLAKDFRTGADKTQEITVAAPANGKLLLTVSEPAIKYNNDLFFTDIDNRGWDFTDDSLKLANVDLDFDASKDSNYHVLVIKSSRGRDENQAEMLASRIQYNVTSQDSVLDLGSGYGIARADKFRDQEVTVLVSVPVGKKIRFDESVADKLNYYGVSVRRSRRGVKVRENRWVFGYKTGVDYIMNEKGYLKSEEEIREQLESEKETESERVDGIQTDTVNKAGKDSLQRMLQEEKTKKEESEKKIKQLENQMKNKGTGYKRVRRDDDSSLPFMPSVFI